jgi:hypothetical protein
MRLSADRNRVNRHPDSEASRTARAVPERLHLNVVAGATRRNHLFVGGPVHVGGYEDVVGLGPVCPNPVLG